MKFLVVQMPEKPIDCPFSKGNFRSGHNCEVSKGKCTLLTSGCEYMIPISIEDDLSTFTAEQAQNICYHCRKEGRLLGRPEIIDGKCDGYRISDNDEPIETCKECPVNLWYED